MKSVTNAPTSSAIAASGFFVIRTPLLAFDELLRWSDALESPTAATKPVWIDEALSTDRGTLRARLAAIVARPEVREAIFVASPSLDESLALWIQDPEGDRGQRVERALVRYFSRMTGRATPFGLFAGCAVGTLAGETRLALEDRASVSRHTRLDMDYLFSLTSALSSDPVVRRQLVYRPNSSLYRAAGRMHYVEARLDGKHRSQHLVSLETTDALDATLDRARGGALFEALAASLVDDEVSLADAEQYVDELIDGQVLVSDLDIPVTGTNPLDAVIEELHVRNASPESGDALKEVRSLLADFDATGLGIPPERYRTVAHALEALPATVDLDRLFQVDLIRGSKSATLAPAVVEELTAGVEILRRIQRPFHHEALRRFREEFANRYEAREVPLVEALDDEAGIGFGSATDTSPLLQDLPFPPAPNDTIEWTQRDTFLLRKLSDALSAGHQELRLGSTDLEALAAKEPAALPNAFSVFAAVAASDDAAIAKGDFLLRIDGVDGPSGARLLGRFCYADPALRRHVEDHLQAEEALEPDAVFAEIAHLPEGRLGNILHRPVLRAFEIPFLGRSGVARERQIPVSDLMVSVHGEEIVLRSASLNRRIVPRLTTAHNFSWRSIGFYRFLCALQSPQEIVRGWDWGPLSGASFLPRIVTGRLVLARARWRLEKRELARFGCCKGRELFAAVQQWREERQLPRWVVLSDGDNTLPVDLDNILSLESFAHLVKERDEAVLIELFPAPDQLCASGGDGRFVHELLVPFVCTADNATADNARKRSIPVANASSAPAVRRSFAPGSEWLYVKLYCGNATADDVLREAISPVVHAAMNDGTADRWFFIRYNDPDSHLRLRMLGNPQTLDRTVWPRLQAALEPLLADGRVRRVVLDTYEREVERYGGPDGIVLAEQLFHADSEAALEIVELLDRGDAGLDERWRLALFGMDRLLADFDFDADTQLAIMIGIRNGFAKEFRVDRPFERQLGDKFRKERSSLSDLLTDARDGVNPLEPGLAAIRQRSEQLRPVVSELKALERRGRLTSSRREIAPSFLHMHANRLLRSAKREQELVLYDFLARHYESRVARVKRTGKHYGTVTSAAATTFMRSEP